MRKMSETSMKKANGGVLPIPFYKGTYYCGKCNKVRSTSWWTVWNHARKCKG